jgi:hypothetical protein
MIRRSILPTKEAFRKSSRQTVCYFLTTHLVWFKALAKANCYVMLISFIVFKGTHTHTQIDLVNK